MIPIETNLAQVHPPWHGCASAPKELTRKFLSGNRAAAIGEADRLPCRPGHCALKPRAHARLRPARGRGGTGRHARFRFWWRKPWGFKSLRPHQAAGDNDRMGSMQVTETLSEGLKRAYTVVLPAAELESKQATRLADLGKTLQLPGFRPGKIPPNVVRQRYGTAVNAEVLEQSVSEATQQVLTDRGLRPALQPKVDVVNLDPSGDQDLEFKVELELLPEITLPDFGALTLTRLKAEAAAETVDKALADIAQRNRTLEPIPQEDLGDRGAANGEVLTVDYVGRIEGAEFPGGTGNGIEVEIGGGGFIPGFSEQLEGMKPDESRTIEVSFPAEYGVPTLAGKAATFDVNAK